MTRIQPLGSKLLVLPITGEEDYITEGNIVVVDTELSRAVVVEVGADVTNVFKKGDVVIFPKSRGTSKHYQGKPHLWIDGQPVNSGGDVWGLEVEEKPVIDKGDSL